MAMTTLQSEETWRLYSWWWDSHISPTNSRWLQENLSDMDGKVKAMIKLIEEDADSFAKRAEMYYKKRPELVNMVEEFYRAYRALAESFDSASADSQKLIEQTDRSEIEVQIMKQALSVSNEEREAMAMETVSKLENDLCCAQIDVERVNGEILEGLKRLMGAQEQCVDLRRSNHDLQLEADNAAKMIIMKNDEILQKNDELEKLQSVKKEHLSLLQLLNDAEKRQDELERDIRQLSNENERLNILNLSSNALIKDMQDDAFNLGKAKKKLQEKVEELIEEKSLLVAENTVLFSQLQALSENMQKLLEENTKMENLSTTVNANLEALRVKWDSLGEREVLACQLKMVEKRLENMENRFLVLEEGYVDMEKEKASVLHQIEKLQVSLSRKEQERETFVLSSEARFVELENKLNLLQEECDLENPKRFYKEEDESVNTEVEICALQECVQDMEENNFCLLMENQRFIAALELSEKLVMELESKNLEQKVALEFLIDETKNLKTGLFKIFLALQSGCKNEVEPVMPQIEKKIEHMKIRLWTLEEEKEQVLIENSILYALISGLELEGRNLNHQFKIKKEQFATVQNDKLALQEYNRRLMLKISNGNHQELLKAEIVKDLRKKLKDLQENYDELWKRNSNEFESEKLYRDLLISGDCEIPFENKIHEQTKERVHSLEDEFGKIRARLSSFDPVICSLNENTTSQKDEVAMVDFLEEHCDHQGISDLRKIQTTIQRLEKAVIELKGSKKDEIRVLKWAPRDEVNDIMKDIQLDDRSNCSFQRILELEKMARKSASGRRSGFRCSSKEKIKILQVQKLKNVGDEKKNRVKNRSSGVLRELIYRDGGRKAKGCFCG